MKIKIFILLILLNSVQAIASTGITYDLTYPISSVILDQDQNFESDLRIDHGFKEHWSIGAQLSFLKSTSEDSSSYSLSGGMTPPRLGEVTDKSIIGFARWYSSGYSHTSFYLGAGAGHSRREFTVYTDETTKTDSSSGVILTSQIGYQWLFAASTGLAFELHYSSSSVERSISSDDPSYTYKFSKDTDKLSPKILFTHRF